MEIAIDRYVKEESSLSQSASVAGVSLWKFLDELRRRNVPSQVFLSRRAGRNTEGACQTKRSNTVGVEFKKKKGYPDNIGPII